MIDLKFILLNSYLHEGYEQNTRVAFMLVKLESAKILWDFEGLENAR